MPKFFGSDSEEENKEEQEEQEVPAIKVPSRFAKGAESEESSSDEENVPKKRVVRSARDKAFDELKVLVEQVKKDMKKGEFGDWNAISESFDKLNKTLDKSKSIISKEGTPNFYIRLLIQLEDFVKTVQTKSEGKSKMNAGNLKNFNSMKTKLKKHNKTFENKIEAFRKNPPAESDEEESEEEWNPDESDEEGVFQQPTFEDEKPKAAPKKPAKKEEESDEESGEHEEEDTEGFTVVSNQRNKWLKDDKKKSSEPKKETEKKETGKKTVAPTKKEDGTAKPSAPAEEGGKKEEKDLDETQIRNKLREILKERGKRNTDVRKQVEKISFLIPHAEKKKFDVLLEVLTQLVASQFDINKNAKSIMPLDLWRQIHANLGKILSILEAHTDFTMPEPDEPEARLDAAESEEGSELPLIGGNLMAFLERLDLELTKRLRSLEMSSPDYSTRLSDENIVLGLAERAQTYYERVSKFKRASRIAYLRLEHYYYKLDVKALEKLPFDAEVPATAQPASNLSASQVVNIDTKPLIENLTNLIYKHGDQRLKTKTLLCHIYYHSLHNRFFVARDMMLMSRLQDNIQNVNDRETQILFNRAMVQLGLSAFRSGLIKQAHSCLSEMYAGGHIKELLAQGTSRQQQQQQQEKKGPSAPEPLPAHMHINTDMMESVHLISALLLEVPNIAANQFDPKKKIISRTFRRFLEGYEKNILNGPPETTRDIILNAAKALSAGEWKRCQDLLFELNIWTLIHNPDSVKAMLKSKIKEEGLRTYIFTFSKYYDALSLEQLANLFELPKNVVHSIISKMMISDELHGSWDQPTGSIIIHHVDPSRLQYLALQFTEKISQFVENNDKLNAPPAAKTGPKPTIQKKGGPREGRRGGRAGRGGDRGERGGERQGGEYRQRRDRPQGERRPQQQQQQQDGDFKQQTKRKRDPRKPTNN